MKKTRFTEEQTVTILREADEKSVPEVAKQDGVSSQLLSVARSTWGYQSRLAVRDATRDRGDARAGGSVPARWLSADSDLLEACRPCDEHGPDASALAPGGAPGAAVSFAAAYW